MTPRTLKAAQLDMGQRRLRLVWHSPELGADIRCYPLPLDDLYAVGDWLKESRQFVHIPYGNIMHNNYLAPDCPEGIEKLLIYYYDLEAIAAYVKRCRQ